MSSTRRDFLRQVSVATAMGFVYPIVRRSLWAATPGGLIPEPDEAWLRELALLAVDAARAAGAEFADVRISAVRAFEFSAFVDVVGQFGQGPTPPSMSLPSLAFTTDYGIRALVDGAWGFAGGYTLTRDAVAEVARTAVSRARANRPRRRRRIELAAVARVEDATWETPIERDPFEVAVGEQAELALAALAAAESVRGTRMASVAMSWHRTVQVFASSEGSRIVQRLSRATPQAWATGQSRDDHMRNNESVEGVRSGGYGFEAVSHAGLDLVDGLREAAERAVAGSKPPGPPPVSTNVGRYDLVLGGGAMLSVLSNTLAPALNLERALGYHVNSAGTSFAAPPGEILGKYEVGSPLVTVRADRTRPHANATVGWDDEGVPAAEWTLIEDGVIVDYLTSRQTAVELAAPYQARGDAVGSRGCALGHGQTEPAITTPNLTLVPGEEDVSVDDLIADTKRGFYVPGALGVSDQQLLSGQFKGGDVHEIRDGKLRHAVKDFAFQFLTPQFWNGVDALGGPDSVVEAVASFQNLRAVPARVRDVNVLNTGITL